MRYLFSVVLSGLVLSLAACQPPSSPEVTAPTATPNPVLTTETEVVWDVPGQDDYPPAPPADPITDETVAAIIDEINQQSASPELTETSETVASLTEPPESVEPVVPETPAAPPPPPEVKPATLIGESFTVLIQRFGAPEYIRRDGAIEIYQYRLPTCVIDFVSLPSTTIAPGIITSTHGRHRKRGRVYDAKQCAIDLGAHNRALITVDS